MSVYDDEYLTTGELNEIIEQERHDADRLQAQYEAEGRALSALRAQGICTHGWMLGGSPTHDRSRADIEEDRQRGNFPDRPTDPAVTSQSAIPEGECLCLDCGQLIPDPCPSR